MKTKWKDTPPAHKIVTICSVIASLSVAVLALLYLFEVWAHAIHVCVPLLGVEMLCQAYIQWNPNRKIAYFIIGTAAFIFICSIVVFFVK